MSNYITEVTSIISRLKTRHDDLSQAEDSDELETAEEVLIPDSPPAMEDTLQFQFSASSNSSNATVTPDDYQESPQNVITNGNHRNSNNIQIPIVGYEVMEERARFTVYKLRVENKSTGTCWYVFRRYTDFVRLCSRLKPTYPLVAQRLPCKRWFGDNFDSTFLEQRIRGLQSFVNAILSVPELLACTQIQDFFCLNEPPVNSDITEESRAIFEALQETIYQLRHQLREKDTTINHLQAALREQTTESSTIKTFLRNSTENCQKCHKDFENFKKSNETNSALSGSKNGPNKNI